MPIRDNSLDDLKIHRAIGVPPSYPLVEVAALMVREGVPAVLVLENSRSVGLVTEHAIVDTVAARRPLDIPVSALMRQPVPAIAANASLVEATALLLSADVDCLEVMDEAGHHVGVLDGRDLLRANERAARCQREADQRLRLMMEAIDDGLWDWNIVEDRFYLNPHSYKALGYEPNALPITSDTWKTLVHPDDLPATWGAVEESMRSGQGFATEFRYRPMYRTKPARPAQILGVFRRDSRRCCARSRVRGERGI